MSTSEARQLAIKVARGILPYTVGSKQAAIRHAMSEFNLEYRRLVGDERYLDVRDEYLRNLYQSLGLKYFGVDQTGEALSEEGDSDIEALKHRIAQSIEDLKKQREVAARERRKLKIKAAQVERDIVNLPPFWFNALIILALSGALDGICWKTAETHLVPIAVLVIGLALGVTIGVLDFLKFRRTVDELRRRAAQLRKEAELAQERVKNIEQQAIRREAEFDLLCTLLARSLDLAMLDEVASEGEPLPEEPPPSEPSSPPPGTPPAS